MYPYQTVPFEHQAELFERTRELESHAVFWEMGTGKTKPTIDTAAHMRMTGKIDALLVLAPKAVAPNWVNDELPLHLPKELPTKMFLWDTSRANGKGYQKELAKFMEPDNEKLAILVMSYDAIMTERKRGAARGLMKGKEAAKKLLTTRRCLFVLDESARIKNPNAKRSKRVLAAGEYAPFRRILTGTPVTNSPFDVFTQLKFLDPNVWAEMGCRSFEAFKTMFGIWIEHERKDNGQRFKQLVDYQNLAMLHDVVDRMGSRLLKDDVLDLPPKVYSKRFFDMCPEQKTLYKKLKEEFLVWLENGDMITVPLAITRMLRLQQVTSGYCPTDDGNMVRIESNPRLSCLIDTVVDIPHQCIIWGKFQEDIDQIAEALPDSVVYDGRVSQSNREERRNLFTAGDVKFFIANPAAAGEGLNLTSAKTVIYYNTTYKLADRLQSEARPHRIGQDVTVNYIDIVATGTIDTVILRALRTKVDLAAQVTGDRIKEWI